MTAYVPPTPPPPPPEPISLREWLAYGLGVGSGALIAFLLGKKDDDDQTVVVVQHQDVK
ncbi:hypothetical protein KAX17_11095 [Candidatus Bipolaricaulota bacterium]|nr:hypothetical protein [Candidatus Bipolaricaulota bacterium]MCK4599233.1 hypothetical protein [Candidatus Bipolaricaulota bacterium]